VTGNSAPFADRPESLQSGRKSSGQRNLQSEGGL